LIEDSKAKHGGKTKHHISIEDSKAIVKLDNFHHRKLREVIEVEKHVKNITSDEG